MDTLDKNENEDTFDVFERQYMSTLTALFVVMKNSFPFMLARLSFAANGVANGIVFHGLGSDEVKAAPLIATFSYGIIGTIRGIILATGILVGRKHGGSRKKDIKHTVNQGWLISLALSLPAMLLLYYAGTILKSIGTDHNVVKKIDDYFSFFIYGIPPTFLLTAEQQFAIGIGKPRITLCAGSVFSLLNMLIGYSLAFDCCGNSVSGIQGVAIGAAIAPWLTLVGLRVYYFFSKDIQPYELFAAPSKDSLRNIIDFFKIGIPLGLQRTSEWGNLAAISVLISTLDDESALAAEQVSLQPMSAFTLMLFALAQTAGVMVSSLIGRINKIKTVQDGSNIQSLKALKHNAKKLGDVAILFGFIMSVVTTVFFIVGSDLLIKALMSDELSKDPAARSQAKNLLIICGVGILFDAIRNVTAGSLRGVDDVVFSPMVGFITMTLVALPIGGYLSLEVEKGSQALFILRDVAMALSALVIAHRWFNTSIAKFTNTLESDDPTRQLLP